MNNVREFYDPNFDFMQDSEWLSPVTKKKVILSLNKGKGRIKMEYMSVLILLIVHFLGFGSQTSEEQLSFASKGVVPNNTLCNTHWTENNFLAWAVECNRLCPEEHVPLDLLQGHDAY